MAGKIDEVKATIKFQMKKVKLNWSMISKRFKLIMAKGAGPISVSCLGATDTRLLSFVVKVATVG